MPMISMASISFSAVVSGVDAGIGVADLIVGLTACRGRRGLGTPDVDAAGALDLVKHFAHPLMRRRSAGPLGVAGLRRLAQRWRSRSRDQGHHPALAGPFLKSPRQFLRESGLGAFDRGESDAALFEASEPHLPLKRLDELNVALAARQRNRVFEGREPRARGGRRRGGRGGGWGWAPRRET